jgi:hypothetical protein
VILEFRLASDPVPFCAISSDFQPDVGDTVAIRRVAYKVLDRQLIIDGNHFNQHMRCELLVRKV